MMILLSHSHSYSSSSKGKKKKKNQVRTPSVKKRETNATIRTDMNVVRQSDMYEGANMSHKGLRMSHYLVRISIVFFFLALSFWVLPPFGVNLDIVGIFVRALFRKSLRWIFRRLGWGPIYLIMFYHCVDWAFSFMEDNLILYAGNDRLDLNVSPVEQALYERKLEEIQNQKQTLADRLEPIISNEAGKYPGINIENLPSPTEIVELLINRIGTQKARRENGYNCPPTLSNNNFHCLKTWLTRACQNAEDAAEGKLPIRSQIRTIIEQSGNNGGEN